MDSYLNENFLEALKVNHSPDEVLQKWRKFCGVVKNPKRRFRFTANLSKRDEAAAMRKSNQEKLRIAVLVQQAAYQFIQGVSANDNGIHVYEEVKAAGFEICAEELESIVEGHDVNKLKFHGGVDGIARKLHTCTTNGLSSDNKLLNRRQGIFGTNKFDEAQVRSFLVFVLEALQDMTLMILAVCAFVSLIVGIVMEGWPEGAHDGLGIVASILLGVFVTATIDYRQALQFRDLDKEKKETSIQVIRNGYRQKMPIYDLLPGDIVHLSIGDQVPADGLLLSGISVSIDESSLSRKSEPVMVNAENPFLLSGTKVQGGSCKMMITTVGMRTKWGKLMATLSKGGDDETPLQLKLNGVATFIGKTGLAFAVVTFAVLVQGLFTRKLLEGTHWSWSEDDALEMLEFFAVAATIVVVAMKNDKALVRHLATCETIGSATSICSDKTGTLTTNRMTVVKACICMNVKDVDRQNTASSFSSGIPDSAVKLLLQSIFNYSGGEVVVNKEGKVEILRSPTEPALLEFGLFLDQGERQASKLIKVEPFNSTKKRMDVVLELPEGGLRAYTKGASEIILAACDKVINSNGEVVPLDDATNDHLNATINQFASEALRTLCLAYMELENGFAPNDPIPLSGYTCIGIVGFKDLVRPGVKESLAISGSTGIAVRMVTGDNINTAKAIARESEILTDDDDKAIEGPDLLGMDIAGTEEAEESTDVIIRGRSVYKNIKKFVQFQLTVNVVALIVNFSSACLIGNAPLTAVQLLWVNMIMDTLGALALPTEPPTDELMKRSPVGRTGNFIRNVMWRNIVCQSLYQFMVFNEISSREMEKMNAFKGISDNYASSCFKS